MDQQPARASEQELIDARALSRHLDQLLDDAALAELEPGVLAVSRRLMDLPSLLPQPDPAFERQVWARLQNMEQSQGSSVKPRGRRPLLPRWDLRWLAPAAALVLVILLVLPGPRQVLGSWISRFRVGSVDVVVAPEPTQRTELEAQRESYAGLEEAAQGTGIVLSAPAYLPDGYQLTSVESVRYEALPEWLQPLYVQSEYRPAEAAQDVNYYATLRQFSASQSGTVRIGQIEYQAPDVRSAEEVSLADGTTAILIEIRSVPGDPDPALRELIWQHQGMTFELWSQVLAPEEMLRMAASVR